MSRPVLPRAWRADLALGFITLIWGATFVVVKQALQDSSTLLFLALRFSLATVALGLAFRPRPGQVTHSKWLLAGGVAAGVCLFAGYLLQCAGLRYTTPSKSAFITGLAIVMVPALGALAQRKLPHPWEVAGVAIATGGMALLTLPGQSLRTVKGDLLTLGCSLAFAVHILVVGYYAPRLGFRTLTLVQISTAAALALSTFWWVETPMIRWRAGGAAIHSAHPDRAHLRPRAGLRLGHLVSAHGGTAEPPRDPGRRADPGRHSAGGIEASRSIVTLASYNEVTCPWRISP